MHVHILEEYLLSRGKICKYIYIYALAPHSSSTQKNSGWCASYFSYTNARLGNLSTTPDLVYLPESKSSWWVQPIRDLDFVLVVARVLAHFPLILHDRSNTPAILLHVEIRLGISRVLCVSVEHAFVRQFPVHGRERFFAVPPANRFARLVGHELPHVGTDVPSP